MGGERSKPPPAPKLSHVAAALVLESWMFVEMALSMILAANRGDPSGCPVDVMRHINKVFKHLRSWLFWGVLP